MISICPHCRKKLKTDKALAGKIGVCPKCKQRFTITETTAKADQASPTVPNSEANTDRPDSIHGSASLAEKNPHSTETEQTSETTTRAKSSKSPSRKKLFVGAALVGLLTCAIIVAGAMYLYPETQGPLTSYIVPLVDDIDGSIDQDWFFFFDQLRRWHERHSIPACFAFYPETMNADEFDRIIAHMYDSETIELVLKGEDQYQGKRLDKMSSVEVLQVLRNWQDKFASELKNLGHSDIQPLVTYNQMMMRLTEPIRDALREAQFKICLEVGGSEYGYLNMLPDFDITQYSVSLTRSGEAGPDEEFKTQDEVIQEFLNFQSDFLIYINGIKVVPFLCNQQDFRRSEDSPDLDEEKWKIYTSLLLRAKRDTRICLLTAREVYNLRHDASIR